MFNAYEFKEAIKLIPNDIKVYVHGKTIFDAKQYLGSSEFMENEYAPSIDHNKPRVFSVNGKKYINMARPKAITEAPETIEVKDNVKADLQLIYDHILNIWCSKNKEQHEWVLNFIACTFGGRKLRKGIYSQCDERCGRGTIVNFISKILGKAMFKTSSSETIIRYTKDLEGLLFVNFDELPAPVSKLEGYSSI